MARTAKTDDLIIQRYRVDKAFDYISRANSVTILSLNEMKALVLRALTGEFDNG